MWFTSQRQNDEVIVMANSQKPGTNTGKNGGIFQEVGPKGGLKPNYATVPDNKPLPPTSKPGQWAPMKMAAEKAF